ncbi:ATP synthase, partial [Candidatus Gastranaerophilus sp. (ex Termes propinquus)]
MLKMSDKTRIVEVFAGAYASGKSESAINRALQYAERGERITLVDLDTVEPAYCVRPLLRELEGLGVDVIAQTDCFGFGEAGSYVSPLQLNCLSREGNIIIDVGYGASGLDTLEIVNGIEDEQDLKIYLIVN